MFSGLCMYLFSIGSKRFAFHERSCMVFRSMYVSLFNNNSRLALHESSFTVFFRDRIICVSIETKDFMIWGQHDMQNVFIIFTPKMMNSPRRSDASWTALSWLRGWMATFVSWPYMRLWIFTCILWFDCPHPIYAPFKCFFESNANLEWMGLHCFPIPEILANHLFPSFTRCTRSVLLVQNW
jgi:hypothetical protein